MIEGGRGAQPSIHFPQIPLSGQHLSFTESGSPLTKLHPCPQSAYQPQHPPSLPPTSCRPCYPGHLTHLAMDAPALLLATVLAMARKGSVKGVARYEKGLTGCVVLGLNSSGSFPTRAMLRALGPPPPPPPGVVALGKDGGGAKPVLLCDCMWGRGGRASAPRFTEVSTLPSGAWPAATLSDARAPASRLLLEPLAAAAVGVEVVEEGAPAAGWGALDRWKAAVGEEWWGGCSESLWPCRPASFPELALPPAPPALPDADVAMGVPNVACFFLLNLSLLPSCCRRPGRLLLTPPTAAAIALPVWPVSECRPSFSFSLSFSGTGPTRPEAERGMGTDWLCCCCAMPGEPGARDRADDAGADARPAFLGPLTAGDPAAVGVPAALAWSSAGCWGVGAGASLAAPALGAAEQGISEGTAPAGPPSPPAMAPV